jgi:hypothetical protein
MKDAYLQVPEICPLYFYNPIGSGIPVTSPIDGMPVGNTFPSLEKELESLEKELELENEVDVPVPISLEKEPEAPIPIPLEVSKPISLEVPMPKSLENDPVISAPTSFENDPVTLVSVIVFPCKPASIIPDPEVNLSDVDVKLVPPIPSLPTEVLILPSIPPPKPSNPRSAPPVLPPDVLLMMVVLVILRVDPPPPVPPEPTSVVSPEFPVDDVLVLEL